MLERRSNLGGAMGPGPFSRTTNHVEYIVQHVHAAIVPKLYISMDPR